MKKSIKIGGQFSGVGAFDQSLNRLGVDYENIYQAEWDKFARQTYLHNYEAPKWYVEDVNDTPMDDIPQLDIAIFSPPCQAFSLAGKRRGEEDKRGVLFYNSHEFIQKNNPRYFIFENVKGLLSDDNGKTFQKWLDYLGGKSINGNPVIFPISEAVPYHIYWKVLNAKDYGVPQNRERVFIIGIRDDQDNDFNWPRSFTLKKRLKDVLEEEVDEKYFLSEKMVRGFIKTGDDKGFINQKSQSSVIHSKGKEVPALQAGTHGYVNGYIQVKSATKAGYEIATENDSINFTHPESETRRGRVGKGVAQTLDTGCNQGVISVIGNIYESGHNAGDIFDTEGIVGTLTCSGVRPSLKNVAPKILSNQKQKNETEKILRLLREEIGEKEIRTWGLRILETIREEEVLRQGMHEESLFGEGEETAVKADKKIQQGKSTGTFTDVLMRSLPEETREGCSPQRRESIKQLIEELNESLQVMSHENPQAESSLQSGELRNESEGIRILREALSEVQKVRQPVNGKKQSIYSNYRIRRLTPREAFRLMDFPDTFSWPVSDSQAYKQAGNSIVVNVLAEIIKKLNL